MVQLTDPGNLLWDHFLPDLRQSTAERWLEGKYSMPAELSVQVLCHSSCRHCGGVSRPQGSNALVSGKWGLRVNRTMLNGCCNNCFYSPTVTFVPCCYPSAGKLDDSGRRSTNHLKNLGQRASRERAIAGNACFKLNPLASFKAGDVFQVKSLLIFWRTSSPNSRSIFLFLSPRLVLLVKCWW